MKFTELEIQGLYIIIPEPFQDERGKFSRIYCQDELKKIAHTKGIVQINHSLTRKKGALRGMHFQYPPKAETKIVKCIKGSIIDVAIDLRKNSPTFLKWHGEIISAENMLMFYIPEGFAHGFQTLENDCELIYFHTESYSPEHEGAIKYDDPKVRITWPIKITDISNKDKNHKLLNDQFEGVLI